MASLICSAVTPGSAAWPLTANSRSSVTNLETLSRSDASSCSLNSFMAGQRGAMKLTAISLLRDRSPTCQKHQNSPFSVSAQTESACWLPR
ncbi:hypothetical protein BS47DRAFT_467216 [Hydnum rufescens UP504]|uniref:Uncharacterized protein n=1 Tax=Hydnum rufescens UP504 TaxID=1448309 RepID=A0A9P6B650_9AGAM|nr:hypothetical protein BS47DRAFT_467216 [Hydnum rufescens UP504]